MQKEKKKKNKGSTYLDAKDKRRREYLKINGMQREETNRNSRKKARVKQEKAEEKYTGKKEEDIKSEEKRTMAVEAKGKKKKGDTVEKR